MAFTLSLNTNPLVNRFADPDDLIDTIAYEIGIRDVQLTHEFVNPGWPAATIVKFVRLFRGALARIADGSYGICNHCEEEISLKRLNAVPQTAYCIKCQEAADRHEFETNDTVEFATAA